MKIYNPRTKQKETFKPIRTDNVKIYYCGPTVYNYAHIWNLRTFVFEDVVNKTLDFVGGFKIHTTMNITDIDDKTIRESINAWVSLKDYTKKYTDIFIEDIKKLNIKPADVIEPISNVIPEMVEIINDLIKKEFAYLSDDGSIYFKISKFKNYGKFAGLDLEWMKESVRIDNDEYEKDSAWDFVLWKAWKKEDGDNFWEETFTFGEEQKIVKWRPGWHIECSACNKKHFGKQIDLHMWGVDLVFPHHQNEIAQSEAHTGKEFSKYWLHSGHLTVDGKKMAKSANNFYTLEDLEKKYSNIDSSVLYRAMRLWFVNSIYRDNVDFSFSKLEQNINTVQKIDELIKRIKRALETSESQINVTTNKGWFIKVKWIRREFREAQQEFIADFMEKLEDDFSTPEALAIFFEYNGFINRELDDNEYSLEELISMKDMLQTMDYVLWITNFEIFGESDEVSAELNALLEERQKARAEKNYAKADQIRDELSDKGYKIIDSKDWAYLEKM